VRVGGRWAREERGSSGGRRRRGRGRRWTGRRWTAVGETVTLMTLRNGCTAAGLGYFASPSWASPPAIRVITQSLRQSLRRLACSTNPNQPSGHRSILNPAISQPQHPQSPTSTHPSWPYSPLSAIPTPKWALSRTKTARTATNLPRAEVAPKSRRSFEAHGE
jgi:hypothetical protein